MTTMQEAIEMLEANGLSHIEILEFVSQSRPGKFKCHKCGKVFERKTCGKTLRFGCPECDYPAPQNILSHDDVSSRIKNVHPDIEIISYTRSTQPIGVRCRKCEHEWKASELDIITMPSFKCPRCHEQDMIDKNLANIRLILDKRKLNNIEIISSGRSSQPVELECKNCGNVFLYRDFRSFKSFKGCPSCNTCLRTTVDDVKRAIENITRDISFVKREGAAVWVLCGECNKISKFIFRHLDELEDIECGPCKQVEKDEKSVKLKLERSGDPIEIIEHQKDKRIVKLRCGRCNHEWEEKVSESKSKIKCPICSQHRAKGDFHRIKQEEYERRLLEMGFDKIEVVDFHSMSNPVTLRCKECGYVWSKAEAKSKMTGCPHCRKDLDTRKDELEEHVHKLNEHIDVISYGGYKKPVELKCNLCGYHWTVSCERTARRARACPQCKYGQRADELRKSNMTSEQEARENMQKHFPKLEMLSYNGQTKPARFRCLECGCEWEEKEAKQITNGVKPGCPSCVKEQRKQQLIESWQSKLDECYENIDVIDIHCEGENDIKLRCRTCKNEWIVPYRKSLIEHTNLHHTNICNECFPRRKSSQPMDERTYRRILQETMGDLVKLVKFNGNNKKSVFECPNGHTWEAVSNQITTRKTGCPSCNQHESLPEQTLFYYFDTLLKDDVYCNAKLNFDDGTSYQVDIFIPSANLIVEYDGFRWHEEPYTINRDKEREKVFAKYGITVLHLREVHKQKGKKRFYIECPYWIDTSSKGKRGRNKQITAAVKDILLKQFGKNNVDIDMTRDEGTIRSYWHSDAVSKAEFNVIHDGQTSFEKLR